MALPVFVYLSTLLQYVHIFNQFRLTKLRPGSRLSMGLFLGASSGWSGSSGRPSSRSTGSKDTRGRELLLKGLLSSSEERGRNQGGADKTEKWCLPVLFNISTTVKLGPRDNSGGHF